MNAQSLKKRIRLLLSFFIVALAISGLTAFPLQWELDLLNRLIAEPPSPVPAMWPALAEWIAFVYRGVQDTHRQYPFMAYGTDWLAFAHLVIAVAFWGPLKDPVRNVWVIEFGMIACVLIIPLALIAGPIRGIPFFWQIVDCSFGVFGIIPLWYCRRMIQRLETLERTSANTGSGVPHD